MQPRHVAWLLAVVPLLVALQPGAGADHPPQAPDDLPAEVASVWFDQLYDLVKTERIAPPLASRIYGLAAITLYEAVVPGSRAHRSLEGQLHALVSVPQPAPHRSYHWPTVANTAVAAAMRLGATAAGTVISSFLTARASRMRSGPLDRPEARGTAAVTMTARGGCPVIQ